MIRDTMIWLSEGLFYLQSGEMLINTPWIFAWVVFWSLVMVLPMIYVVNVKPFKWAPLLFMAMFFPGLLMAIGPGIVQVQMMQECRNVTVNIETESVSATEIAMSECRYKDNFYGEFGEWQIVNRVTP